MALRLPVYLLAVLFLPAPATAELLFTLERLDNQTVILTGSGTVDGGLGLRELIGVLGVVIDPAISDGSVDGDFAIGSRSLVGVSTEGDDLLLTLDGAPSEGDVPTGSARLTINEVFAFPGSSGSLVWDSRQFIVVDAGDWTMVPEPSTGLLLSLGLGALGARRSRRY